MAAYSLYSYDIVYAILLKFVQGLLQFSVKQFIKDKKFILFHIHLIIFRLLAEKMNKNERKNKAEIIVEALNEESADFWKALGEGDGMKPEEPVIVSFVNSFFTCDSKGFFNSYVLNMLVILCLFYITYILFKLQFAPPNLENLFLQC